MTNEEYDALSDQFALINAELINAKGTPSEIEVRTRFNAARIELDAAYAELNGHEIVETL